ncbi:MAG: bacillithiol biosynthesis cysteine-adding enzyme BshC [Bacteroidetes bacterium]|nr:bacillithiol biosynthesis cysteine-adding enzyme BshC [Bacteroidota bacterium]MBS1943471.1 bacillithiol biosynthesis cysteine-adding enzyme BshC [Bacteroidota bacterium]
MERIPVPYRATGRFTELICDYLDADPRLREFFQGEANAAGLAQAAKARRFDVRAREVLCGAVQRQYSGMELHPEVRANVERLRQPETLTVTTGHQLCLFTGPLYVPFKILNVVRLARQLSTPERPVVPVFWMATEDHDRQEIDHAYINGTKVQWPGEAAGAVGRLKLDGIEPVLDQVDSLLGPGSHADAMRALLRRCYRPEHDLATATRCFVDALFGRFGVLVLDADDPQLKQIFAPVMRQELLNQIAERSVHYADQRLSVHYKTQAFARPINLFYLRPGHRGRIERVGEKYQVLEGGPAFSFDELLAELEAHPERFSPNVLLRPVYQETILPNIAYVGGGGELAYWFQLKWLFQAVQVPMPVLMLRTSAAFIGAKDLQRLEKLGLNAGDLFAPLEDLYVRLARKNSPFSTSLEKEMGTTRAFYTELRARAGAADPTLAAAVEAMEKKALRRLEALGSKLLRAAKRQQREPLDQLDTVHGHFFPGGGLQERRENFMSWYAREGPAFFDRLLAELDPLDPCFSVLPG